MLAVDDVLGGRLARMEEREMYTSFKLSLMKQAFSPPGLVQI